MRIDVHDLQRQRLFSLDVDPASPVGRATVPNSQPPTTIRFDWDGAITESGGLCRCPVCGCRELYVRKDFPHLLGLSMVVGTAAAAVVLFALGRVVWGLSVLVAVAVIDAVIFPFFKKCLVCYRCRSEFRHLPIPSDQPAWDLAIGEKYRSVPGGTAEPS